MIAVISPSKTQDFTALENIDFSNLRQEKSSLELIPTMQKMSQDDIASLMKISDNLAELNFKRFQGFSSTFDLTNSKQALFAFKGDVYTGIDAASLSNNDLEFAQKNLRMLSGLYGVVRPLDLIQPYRLEMGTRLETTSGKNLYQFWGDKISKVLNEDESEVLINLASNEYFKGIDKKALDARIIDIAFKEMKDGKLKIIGIHAKRARGMMVRFIIDNRIEDPEELKKFNLDKYEFDEGLSDEKTWVFCR
jgi:cytoplasmic iron level regulating protein YaaA (DUF328/UPF0246 family)